MKQYIVKTALKLCVWPMVLFVCLIACRGKTEDCTETDYNNCNDSRPEVAGVYLELTINTENPRPVIHIYEGHYEEGNLLLSETPVVAIARYYLRPDRYYSATATYMDKGQTVVALDGGELKVISYPMCELRCYEAKELTLDLRLNK